MSCVYGGKIITGIMVCVYGGKIMQDDEQLKLSVQQGGLLKQQLDESQAHAAAAARQVQHAEAQTQMTQRRMTALQTQVEEQQAQTRYSPILKLKEYPLHPPPTGLTSSFVAQQPCAFLFYL